MTSVGYTFLCGRSRGVNPPPPSAYIHISPTPPCGRHKLMAHMTSRTILASCSQCQYYLIPATGFTTLAVAAMIHHSATMVGHDFRSHSSRRFSVLWTNESRFCV